MQNSAKRILIAGAGGTLGLPLTRRLVATGNEVVGLTRSAWKRSLIEATGARAVVADALDPADVTAAVSEARPTHVVNLLTALPAAGVLRPSELRATNTLRIHGSSILLRAALEAGVSRIVAESFLAVYGRSNTRKWLTEDEPLDEPASSDPLRETILALRSLEAQHAEARQNGWIETVVLRFGFFYGPNVTSTESLLRRLRARRMFIPRGTGGAASWIHIGDAVDATVAALDHPGPSPIYNIADDEPMTLEQALHEACRAFGAPEPRSWPAWLLRWAAPVAVSLTSAQLGMDNSRAKRELGWRPAYPSLREGFAELVLNGRKAA